MRKKLVSHRMHGLLLSLLGCFACLLLAASGCRVSSSAIVSSPASTIEYGSESKFPLSTATSPVRLPPPLEAEPIESVAMGPTEFEQPIQLASLESDLPVGAVPMRLEDAILLSLEKNPDLIAVRASEPVAHAALHVAEVYPWNPQFQTQVLPYSRDRNGNDGAVSQQHVIVQTFEFGGQRSFRTRAAAANWRQVSGTVLQAELMNVAQTTRLFYAAIYQRELYDMSRSLADMNEQLAGVMQRRQKAGQANRADVDLARLQSQSSRRQQRLAETNYQTSLMQLRNQLNLDAYAPLELDSHWIHMRWQSLDALIFGSLNSQSNNGSLDSFPKGFYETDDIHRFDGDATLRQLVANRPDVVVARAAVAVASENLNLANAMRRPNLQAGPMWQRDVVSTQFWGVQAQIDIPVVNTGKPLVRQRIAERRQKSITAEQLENRAVLEARAAIQRYERARQLVEQSRSEMKFSVPEALAPFEDQFRAGQITLLQVFAARAAIAQSQQSFLGLLNELALAAANVMQATGMSPQQMMMDIEPLPSVPEEVPAL